MDFIPIKRSKQDLLNQFRSLKQIENFNYRRLYGRLFIFVIMLTTAVAFIFLLTDADDMIKFKGVSFVLIAMIWVCLLIFLVWHIVKRVKTNNRINDVVNEEIGKNKQYFMNFGDEGLLHGSDDYRTEVKWSHFIGYLESPNAVFLFTEFSIYSCISFSKREIGEDNYELLKTKVKDYVPVLHNKLHLT